MSDGEDTHWCYQCERSVCLQGEPIVCPCCDGGFVQELNEIVDVVPQEFYGLGARDQSDDLSVMFDEFTSFVRNRSSDDSFRFLHEFIRFMRLRARERMTRRNRLSGIRERSGSIPEQSGGTIRQGQLDPGPGALFLDMGLEELMERLMIRGRLGPLPASRSSIEAIPTIEITQRHLRTDSHCSVCLDAFELGSQARQMPCNHIYHSDCIIPWLVRHNTCPVCRYSMPRGYGTVRENQTSNARSRSRHLGSERRRRSQGFWAPISAVSSSGSSISSPYYHSGRGSNYYGQAGEGNPVSYPENHEMNQFEWPFDY